MKKFVAYYEKQGQERGFFKDEQENTIVIVAPDYETAHSAFTSIVDSWEEMNQNAGFEPTENAYDFEVDSADNHNLYNCKEYSCEDF